MTNYKVKDIYYFICLFLANLKSNKISINIRSILSVKPAGEKFACRRRNRHI